MLALPSTVENDQKPDGVRAPDGRCHADRSCVFPAEAGREMCRAHRVREEDPRLFEQAESPYAGDGKRDYSGLSSVNPTVRRDQEKKKAQRIASSGLRVRKTRPGNSAGYSGRLSKKAK